MCEFYRVLVEGVLECQTDVHVGDGGDEAIEAERFQVPGSPERQPRNSKDLLDNKTRYNRCVSRRSGELVLPGSTLRGSLRSGLSDKAIREKLFGPDKIGEGGQQGGIVRVDDAFWEFCGNETEVRHWHPGRKTGLRIGISIDAVTETVKPKALFYYEIYPAGTRFKVSLAMDWVNQEDIDNLKTALQCWNGDISGNLGARKSKSWGVMKWGDYTISVIEMVAIREWFESPDNESSKEPIEKKAHEKVNGSQITFGGVVTALTLTTLQPLLVDDPGRVLEKKDDDERLPNKETYRTTQGKYAIPAESFAGACRGEARRIVTTLVYLKTNNHPFASELAEEMINDLFGGPLQGSCIQFSDFIQQGNLDPHEQCFNAIDRFTGGVAENEQGGKFYNVVAIPPKADLKCAGIVFPRGLAPWQAGLVYLVFRELHAKRFWLGGFRAKGYGLVGLDNASFDLLKNDLIAKVEKKTTQEMVTALQNEVKKRAKKSPNKNKKPVSNTIYDSPGATSFTNGNGITATTSGEQLNPYAFVPVKALWNAGNCPAYSEIKEKGIRHDLYIPERHTGVITCTLKTVTDTFVGNRHKQIDAKDSKRKVITQGNDEVEITHVHPYFHDKKPAFPANSLRGMIGNVIETLSQSSLRVLENKYLSIRKLPGKNRPFSNGRSPLLNKNKKYPLLSAIGRVVKREGDWYIEPLTLPHLRYRDKTVQVSSEWKKAFSGIPFQECLSAYISRKEATSYGPDNQDIYKIKTKFNNTKIVGEKLPDTTDGLKKNYLILGQVVVWDSLKKYDTDLEHSEIKGYIRELANNGHEFPLDRKYELFIPEPVTTRVPIRVTSAAKDKFDRLCKQAMSAKCRADEPPKQTAEEQTTAPTRPERLVMPTGYNKHQLQENMLLCFDIKGTPGEELEVSEISFSAIWREPFELETTCEAFAAIDDYLLPWGTLPNRNWLTPAEAMLGVVEEAPNVDSQRNLASRLRFTDGLFVGDGEPEQTDGKVILKILSSPKPPSPNLYFHDASTNGQRKILPNGRKIYLRHHPDQVTSEYYRTKDEGENRKQKIICKPITKNQKFSFDIHYRNLDSDEMKLLLTAIEPGNGFVHKLGLGKPLGLGSVKIEITQTKERNISKCFAPADRNVTDKEFIGDSAPDSKDKDHGKLVDPGTLQYLQQLGKTRDANELITYPLTKAQVTALNLDSGKKIRAWAERELFRWHVSNTGKNPPATLWGSCGAFNTDDDFNNGQLMFGVLKNKTTGSQRSHKTQTSKFSGKGASENLKWVIEYKKKGKVKTIDEMRFHGKEDRKNLYEDIKTKVSNFKADGKYQVLFVYKEGYVTLLEILS